MPSLIGVIIVTFLLTRVLPGDTAAYFAGPAATPEAIEQIRAKLGLDQPLPEQFVRYVARSGERRSRRLAHHRPAGAERDRDAPAGLGRADPARAHHVAVDRGAARHHGGGEAGLVVDHACRVVATAGVSLPVFFTGLLLVYVFYYLLGWAPAPLGRLDVFSARRRTSPASI